MLFTLFVNGRRYVADVDPGTPVLWVLRDTLGLTGTKFSCGIGQCGACTVHLDGAAIRSCVIPVEQVKDSAITTIEGLSPNGHHILQSAWEKFDVPQCGYCQPGQIMAAAALLAVKPNPTDEDIDNQMSNACRCGTYLRIRQAIHSAAKDIAANGKKAERD